MKLTASLAAIVALSVPLTLVMACSDDPSPPAAGGGADAAAEANVVPSQCVASRAEHLRPVASVAAGAVAVVRTDGDTKTLYVDASAGGAFAADKSARVYIKLTGEKVAIDDETAFSDPSWDLALKRVDIYTNGGDAGIGQGGAARIEKDFAAVTAADADAAEIKAEILFDSECNGRLVEGDFISTSFDGWYDYAVEAGPSVHPGRTFIVRGGTGLRYKVAVVSYRANADGSTDGQVTARYLLQVAPL